MGIKIQEYHKEYLKKSWNGDTPFNVDVKMFRLDAPNTSYVFGVTDEGYLIHGYFGKKICGDDLTYLLRLEENPWVPKANMRDKGTFMDSAAFEYPCHGTGDYREPCLMVMDDEGVTSPLIFIPIFLMSVKIFIKIEHLHVKLYFVSFYLITIQTQFND